MTTVSPHNTEIERLNTLPSWLAEMKSALGGKVRWDDVTLQLYSTAACFNEITRLAVIIPHDTHDLMTAIEICAKRKIPILPRGAGSSLSGNAVGEAVILDLSHHFKEISEIDGERVRSGVSVILDNLQKRLNQTQINQGTGLKVIHPITLLNMSVQPSR